MNVTPDSFSDGGKYIHIDTALHQIEKMISQGADIIDIGGESTRPGANLVSATEEMQRVIPLIKAIKQRFNIPVSIDTSKASVMAAAIDAEVDMINDVRALQNEGALAVVAQAALPICLMHMQGVPQSMQNNPHYNDVITDIIDFFKQRIAACSLAGIATERLLIDPGFGFGKTVQQNFRLLAQLAEFQSFKLPILVGLSRKSMIGKVLNCEVEQRLVGSVSAALLAAQNGANILRVHDVKATVEALKILNAMITA